MWTGSRAYLLGSALYLPQAWITDAARARARIPAAIRFQEKWRQALTLLRQVRASGITVTGVLADAEFGDNRVFRGLLHRLRLPYALGISSHLTVFVGTPRLRTPRPARRGRPRKHPQLVRGATARALSDAIVAAGGRWHRVRWRNRPTARQWTVECVAIRVTPAVDCRHRRLMPEVWLLAERDVGATPRTKYYFVNLPPTASLRQIVRLAHQRWAIEQQYQDLKTELGLDHFEGRTFRGWHHHVVLTAITYNFLQTERQRHQARLTFPSVHGIVQEILQRICLPSDRTTSPASRRCGPFSYGSDKVVPRSCLIKTARTSGSARLRAVGASARSRRRLGEGGSVAGGRRGAPGSPRASQ